MDKMLFLGPRYPVTIDQFLAALDEAPTDLLEFQNNKYNKVPFENRGMGTPELEMEYIHRLFLKVQAAHPDFETFSWEQFYDYDDESYNFKLVYFTINEKLWIWNDTTSLELSPEGIVTGKDFEFQIDEDEEYPEVIEFAKKYNLEGAFYGWPNDRYNEFFTHLNNKYKTLQLPTIKMKVLLDMLEMTAGSYYFLYTFGNGTKVKLQKEGIEVSKIPDDEYEGESLGTGFRMPEL